MESTIVLEGAISVKAALEGGRRPVFELLCDARKPDRNRSYILRLAEKAGVAVKICGAEELNALACGHSHGGLLAKVGARNYEPVEDLFAQKDPFLAVLDGVEDPYNLGMSLRSLYAAGVTGILLPKRDRTTTASILVKSSAGASELLPIACPDTWEGIPDAAHKAGIRILCAERKDAISLYEENLTGKIMLVFGGEMRGISAPLLQGADKNLFLPYGSDFRNALSASAAAAVFAFEAYRQRNR